MTPITSRVMGVKKIRSVPLEVVVWGVKPIVLKVSLIWPFPPRQHCIFWGWGKLMVLPFELTRLEILKPPKKQNFLNKKQKRNI